jgi:hypothetical protein
VVFANATYLHGPVGLALAPNGDLITANSDAVNTDPNQPSELVEFTTRGRFVSQLSVDPNNGGAFGLAFGIIGGTERLAAVDDNGTTLNVWTIPVPTGDKDKDGDDGGSDWHSGKRSNSATNAYFATYYH